MLTTHKIAPNRYVADIPGGQLFYSYETPVAARINGRLFRTEKKWSVTTTQHINWWLDSTQVETKAQEWFDALRRGEDPEAEPFNPLEDAQVFVGGITLLIQQPGDKHGTTRMVEDEDDFIEALEKEVGHFRGIDVHPSYSMGSLHAPVSITLLNGIIPVSFDVPEGVDLNEFANRKAQEVLHIWERFAV